jgi:hypothetical protein
MMGAVWGRHARTALLGGIGSLLASGCQRLNPAFDEDFTGVGESESDGGGSDGDDSGGGTSDDGGTLPGCDNVPELPDVVGPYQEITIGNAKLEGSSQSWIEVAPGATVELSFNYQVASCGCPTCTIQGVVGLTEHDWRDCFYHGAPGCEGVADVAVLTFTAPTEPGDYTLSFDRTQEASCQPGSAVLRPDQAFAGICVPN